MATFVYRGPPHEPEVAGTFSAMTGTWQRDVPRDIAEAAQVAWLRRHPHWSEVTPAHDASDKAKGRKWPR